MTIAVEVWAQSINDLATYRVTEGTFIFVAIDHDGHPRKVPEHR
jgi:acyl-CoA thioesterase YciA